MRRLSAKRLCVSGLVISSSLILAADEPLQISDTPRFVAGIFCNSRESAEYVAGSLTRSQNEIGIERAHIAMHIQQGRAGVVRASHPKYSIWRQMQPTLHPLWCAWQVKLVQHATLFRAVTPRGEVHEVALVSTDEMPEPGIFDLATFFVTGTELPPEINVASTASVLREALGSKEE
ncbi:MAG: hypothetical protein KBE09_03380 [Candidatus Pacebacteria bacterium]|nr:hypothetical protein [Candidatus Paceibacterota bacterium]